MSISKNVIFRNSKSIRKIEKSIKNRSFCLVFFKKTLKIHDSCVMIII